MKSKFKLFLILRDVSIIIFALLICSCNNEKTINLRPNTLTRNEIKDGWVLLWDGQTFNGWRGIYQDKIPVTGWVIENGELICLGNEKPDSLKGGDIVTLQKYGSFELRCEFKIKDKANSGIKYFVDESLKSGSKHGLGLEYAILDNENWPYDRLDYNRTCGSLYDLIRAPEDTYTLSKGKWNQAIIIVNGNHIEHWLNGVKTVDIEKGSERYYQLLEKSKYAKIKGWGEFQNGHILLQDEGPRTSFRNIKIKAL